MLVIFLDGLVGGLYRAAGKTTAAKVIGWIMAAAYVLSILSFVELPAALANVSRIVTVVSYDRGHHHGHHERKITFFCGLSAAAPAILSGCPEPRAAVKYSRKK
ncbi:MAG: hypothetical protein ACLU3F_15610 [Blautia wexlerae]